MSDFTAFLNAPAEDRRGAFLATAARLDTGEVNVEKDFWVCWTLDALFNRLTGERPRLLFKGGTSLSKGYGLISRFSEDIDVTVFRDDLGQAAEIADLEAMTGRKRKAKLLAIKQACQAYIAGPLREQLSGLLAETIAAAGIDAPTARIEPDPDDPDAQTLLLWYPSVSAPADGAAYIRPAVKIESGAKSALDPNQPRRITPYVDEDLPDLKLAVDGITTVDPERTFWDKVVIASPIDLIGIQSRIYLDAVRGFRCGGFETGLELARARTSCRASALPPGKRLKIWPSQHRIRKEWSHDPEAE